MKSERQIRCDTTYMWDLKHGTMNPSTKQNYGQRKKTNLWLPNGWGTEEG